MKTVLNSEPNQVTRLFSHLELDGDKLNHQPGSVFGSTALIAGTTIGAGILALPSVTLPSGVFPSTTILIVVWLYTLVAGFLIAEVTVNTMRVQGLPNLGLLAVVEKTLGPLGARIAGAIYLLNHYLVLVAYITKGGEIFISAVAKIWGLENPLPNWLGTTTFTLVFGGIMYLGRERLIQRLNNIFVAIIIVSFLGLMLLGVGQIKGSQFLFQDWNAVISTVSIICVTLFYHNVIPVVVTQLEGDIPKIRQSIVIGSGIPLIMFLAWNAIILGSVTPDMLQETKSSGFDPLQILRDGGAGAWLGILLTIFSEFAIITSFIGFVYGLLDFFQDLSVITEGELSRLPLYSLVLLPPMGFGTLNPSIFFVALDYTGILTVSILCGIIPALMSWKQRHESEITNSIHQELVPGGRLTLVVVMLIAVGLIVKQILSIYPFRFI